MLRVRNVPKATWTAVAGMLAVTAVLVLVVISGRTSIRAEDPPDAPVAATTTPLVITEETMHLLPPLDLSIVPTVVPPPCVKRHMEKYSYSSNWYLGKPKITRAWGIGRPNGCALIGPDGNVISEEEADRLLAESEPARVRWEAEKQDRMQGEWASWREISLVDGSKLKLPHDVRIVDYSVVIYGYYTPNLTANLSSDRLRM